MIDFQTYKEPIKAWLDSTTSMISVGLEQNAAVRPDKPYIAFKMRSSTEVHEDAVNAPNASGVAIISGNREFNLEIQGFGGGVNTALEKVRASRHLPTVQQTFRTLGLVLVDSEPVLDITTREGTRIVERAALEMLFRVGVEQTDDIGLVESVEITTEVIDDGGNTVVEETNTITTP